MGRECRERFPRHRRWAIPTFITARASHVTHVPWCMPGSLTSGCLWNRRRGKNVPSIPGACTTCNFTYLVRGPWYLPIPYTPSSLHTSPHAWCQDVMTKFHILAVISLACHKSSWIPDYAGPGHLCVVHISHSIWYPGRAQYCLVFNNPQPPMISNSWPLYIWVLV